MIVKHETSVEKENVYHEGAKGVKIQWLINEKSGAVDFYMRLITIKPGGIVPLHTHDAEHEIYVIKGNGAVLAKDNETEMNPGTFVYISGSEVHGFKNIGEDELKVICCINS